MDFADGQQPELGTSVRVEHSPDRSDHQVLSPGVDVASDTWYMVGHVPQGTVASKYLAAFFRGGGVFSSTPLNHV